MAIQLTYNSAEIQALLGKAAASETGIGKLRDETVPEMVMHSSFDWLDGGWWNSSGNLVNTSNKHSALVPIVPGARHYMGYTIGTASSTIGAFFDRNGAWISTLTAGDLTEYGPRADDSDASKTDDNSYLVPSGNIAGMSAADQATALAKYVPLYFFTAPATAYYFSYNQATSDERGWRQYISTKPVFMLSDAGSYVARPGDPVYQAKKNKKLCIIGPSSVMIDRWDRASQGNDTPWAVGFQEYLAPWYAQVDSYGFSGGAMYPATGESATSMYNGIVTAQLDLSGYDEFLISGSTNGLTDDVVDDWDSTDTTKYFGALNGIIDYIYAQNPTAKIYLTDLSRKQGYYTYADTYRARIDTVNERTASLAEKRAYTLVPVSVGSECNSHTYSAYSYDGTHGNSAGNRVYGLFCRKIMLGF